jgi:uncharacterized membrane protein YkvA (DUF1232 family)
MVCPSVRVSDGRVADDGVVLIEALVGIGAGLLVSWLALLVYVWIRRPSAGSTGEGVRLLPDVLRLARRLARDPSASRGVRIRLWMLLAYLAFPIDLVPDFVPVIGYADDVVIVAAILRSVVRSAGPAAIRRNWPGTPEGLQTLWNIARLPGTP